MFAVERTKGSPFVVSDVPPAGGDLLGRPAEDLAADEVNGAAGGRDVVGRDHDAALPQHLGGPWL